MNAIKGLLSGAGLILFYLFSILVCILPLLAIGFDLWLIIVLSIIIGIVPFINIIFWVWAIVLIILGKDHLNNVETVIFWIGIVLSFGQYVIDFVLKVADRH